MSIEMQELLSLAGSGLRLEGNSIKVADVAQFRAAVASLAEISALGEGKRQGWARYILRLAALELGIIPASIHELYLARGRGDVPMTFTVPAINLRVLSFDAARAVFRSAKKVDGSAILFEIARSEIGYSAQRPAEYASNILAAAIVEGWSGPVFIQGDHFQVSGKKYAADPGKELQAVRELTNEAIAAGFYNIDIDTSTLVDITLPTVPEQQALNSRLSAEFTAYIRSLEPNGVTISVGGEIGEVGGHNSTEAELRAYMDGFNAELARLAPGAPGLSKISIQTGTSHGGVVLPDGKIAHVSVDFDTLRDLSRVARRDYGLAGTVQHGASTLPENAFGNFVEYEATEVHLATNFMNIFYDKIPATLRNEMYAWLDVNSASERKPDMTDEQFYYKTRKNALGAFKAQSWRLPDAMKAGIGAAYEEQFDRLFRMLQLAGTRRIVDRYIEPLPVAPKLEDYLGTDAAAEDVRDLAD
ncbi:MAG: aldolase [Chloroflexi bacterium]|nr:aldolase [Chloroflexota bacterium]